jgi:hypothetical protein
MEEVNYDIALKKGIYSIHTTEGAIIEEEIRKSFHFLLTLLPNW